MAIKVQPRAAVPDEFIHQVVQIAIERVKGIQNELDMM
jgi:hypothetical protein